MENVRITTFMVVFILTLFPNFLEVLMHFGEVGFISLYCIGIYIECYRMFYYNVLVLGIKGF